MNGSTGITGAELQAVRIGKETVDKETGARGPSAGIKG
jgi:hypothetical protein